MLQTIKDKIAAAAAAYGISPALALAVAQAESAGDAGAVSSAGAQGLFQLMPHTAAAYGVTDVFDADQNIDGGVHMLADLSRQYAGDLSSILAAYNWGSGNLASGRPMPAETTNYIARIRRLLAMQEDPGAAAPLVDAGAIAAPGLPDWALQAAVGLAAVSAAWLVARMLRR